MEMGAVVKVIEGASDWMKKRNYWLDGYGESIDGKFGVISHDYTAFSGDDSHYVVDFEGIEPGIEIQVGINPMWLIEINK